MPGPRADHLDEIGERIGELLKPELPHGFSGVRDAFGKLAELKRVPPKHVKKAPVQEVVLTGDDVDLDALPALHTWPDDGGVVLQPGPDPHQAPGDRRPQPGPVPVAAAGQAHHRHALADPQGHPQPLRGRAAPRRTAAGRHRLRLPARRHLRRHRAAARRTSTSTCSPASCRASGSRWSTARRCRCRCRRTPRWCSEGWLEPGRDAAGGAVRRPHRLLHPAGALPGADRRLRHDAAAPDAPVHRRGPAADRGRTAGQGHRAVLPAAAEDHHPGHRRLHLPEAGGFHNCAIVSIDKGTPSTRRR